MNKLIIFLILFFMVGCASSGKHLPEIVEVQGIGESPSFPLSAAGFQRGKILTDSKGEYGFSTAYNLNTKDNQIGSTIYIFPKKFSLKDTFEGDKQGILLIYQSAKLIGTRTLTLAKNNAQYQAYQATFTIGDDDQKLFSQLILWEHKGKFLKLRSTSPYSQKDQNLVKNMELLNSVNWAF